MVFATSSPRPVANVFRIAEVSSLVPASLLYSLDPSVISFVFASRFYFSVRTWIDMTLVERGWIVI